MIWHRTSWLWTDFVLDGLVVNEFGIAIVGCGMIL